MDTLKAIAESMEQTTTARIAAGLVYKNRLISIGVNEMKSHPFQAKYGKNKDSIFLHAEISTIKNALRKIDVDAFKNATLLIARLKRPSAQAKTWIYGLAKPCSGCTRAIADFNIGNVIYTDENGEFVKL